MREINLNRQKLGLEDLLFGVGIVTQIRAGQNVDVTKINAGNLPFDETQSLFEWAQSINLEVLGSMITELQAIYDNLTAIGNVEDNLTVINTLEDNLVALNSLYTNISKLQNIDTNMSKLQNIDTNMSKLQAIYTDLTKLESIYDNLTMLLAIYNNLTALNNINSQVIPNLTELLLVNDNAIQVAADKLTVATDKGIVSGYKEDVSAMKVAVETIYDTFDDRFLGVKALDPTVDNDGNALLDGAIYFNSVSHTLKVYSLTNTTWYAIPQLYLSALLDVLLTSITTGDILTWNGTKWINTTIDSKIDLHGRTAKTTLANADEIMFADSSSAWSLKKITWGNIKTVLESLFISKVTSTDNAIVRFDGTGGVVQDSKVTINDNGFINVDTLTAGEHLFKPNSTSGYSKLSVASSDYSSLPSWASTGIMHYGNTAIGNFISGIANAGLSTLWSQNVTNMLIGTNSNSPIIFANNNTEKVRIDQSGKLIVGATSIPNTSSSSMKYTQVGNNTFLINNGNITYLTTNAIHNGTNWVYVSTGSASLIDMSAGSYIIYTATSGIAGAAIPWVQAVTTNKSADSDKIDGFNLDANGVPLFKGFTEAGVHSHYTGNLNYIEWNSLYNFDSASASNSPLTGWGFVQTMIHSYGTAHATQLCYSMNAGAGDGKVFIRRKGDGTWGSWRQFIVGNTVGALDITTTASAEHLLKPSTTSQFSKFTVGASDYTSLPSYSGVFMEYLGSAVSGNYITGVPNASLAKVMAQNCSNLVLGTNGDNNIIFVNGYGEKARINNAGVLTVNNHIQSDKFLNTEASSTIVIDGTPVLNTDTKGYLIKGTSSTPSNDLQYDKPAMYIEVNSNTNVTANSNWGNAKKAGGLFIEAKSWNGFNGELNSAYFRTYTSQYSAGNENVLVGISAIAQTNTGAGNNSADVWGANIIAAQTSGNAPQDIVGIEVDVLHSSASTTSTNYTGVWCQADGLGQYSNNAFMATRSGQSAGWRHVLKADVEALDSTIEVKNGLNAPGADGMNIGITYSAENTNIINAYTGTYTNTNFKVTGDVSYPVWIKINGVLKKVMEGPPNSGGAGYKQLIVVN